jgi:hypothetical protein
VLEEMASMTRRNAESIGRVKELGSQARHAGDVGLRDMAEMTAATRATQASSDDIAKISKTIDGIAFQTNIVLSRFDAFRGIGSTQPVVTLELQRDVDRKGEA